MTKLKAEVDFGDSRPPEYAYSVNLSQAQVDYINLSYNALVESTYQALAVQTRLAAYMDQVELTFDASNNLAFNFAPLEAKLDLLNSTDRANALIDLAELIRFDQQSLRDTGWIETGLTKLQGYAVAAQAEIAAGGAGNAALDAAFAGMGIRITTAGVLLSGSNGSEFLFGTNAADTINAHDGSDFILAGAGNDVVDEAASRRANQFALHSYSIAAKVASGRTDWHGGHMGFTTEGGSRIFRIAKKRFCSRSTTRRDMNLVFGATHGVAP